VSRYPLEGYRERCATDVTIGTRFAREPIHLDIPITIAGMSFGALSGPAKEALGRGATEAGIDQRSACRHPDWTGPDDLEIKIEELREITDWRPGSPPRSPSWPPASTPSRGAGGWPTTCARSPWRRRRWPARAASPMSTTSSPRTW
jgi:hypothetical protein